ncbi:2-hydroxyacid dehydrogenase [Thermosipho melanesiensis]|uniref:D-isomer specific 2-hydroxyacid dehydrogenase, NAD-binding n=2 Tax=Thermosipho melanesiensis TaxID=46541 RepID=A6LJ60_THEM4|nr:2-hydroxyacid dehydrogenase [Thermosipho melanesiensis]ABR29961.1 D-isomer specific 2-hydroxyacid dehydrogenase, NAD-binding [Thermosipho melanesiensis BI429]APT73165.1 2-hydroxyacid dehydrogenase [Thermosipho melanesiensis]OOC38562.1 2-hydroxyacid dehydrogenase [Thermosipho melanesiensis]OOC40366.1 2-hydroxyacid dehydrogenase [Thermosipho melanesiensis]OOC40630.1 2-hydroxyacid dehydrogenase [Thermosipho melanesiensis]
MKALVLTKITDYFKKRIEEFKQIDWYTDIELLDEVDIVVGGFLTEEQVKKAKKLKAIFVPWTGADKLPWKILKERNIVVSNSHGNGKMVAERAVALSLALMGRVVEYHNDLEKGIWHGFAVGFKEEDYWFSLQNKKVAILGTGVIGKNIAKLLKGFSCYIVGFRNKLEQIGEFDKITNKLDEAVKEAQVVYLALPLTNKTKYIINRELLFNMDGKFLINVGRGELIDESALYEVLEKEILKGFASDVWYNYPSKEREIILPFNYPIHKFKNVVLSPHVGGYTIEGQNGRIDELFKNIKSFLETGKPLTMVDPELMY